MSSEPAQRKTIDSESAGRVEGAGGGPGPSKHAFGRLHGTSIFFDIASGIYTLSFRNCAFRTLIVPAFIVFIAAQGLSWWLVLGFVLFVPTVLSSIVRYFTLRFRIHEEELVVTQGLLFRRVRTVPVKRIQNLNLVQNPLHRLVRVAEVRVETASGSEPEATLRVVPMAHVGALREAIFEPGASSAVADPEDSRSVDEGIAAETEDSELLRIPTSWLCRAGLASDRGSILIGVLIGAAYPLNLYDRLGVGRLAGFLGDFAGLAVPRSWDDVTWYAILFFVFMAAMGLVLLTRVLGMAWYILRFHDYRLTRAGDELRISCGLLTKVSATVPRERIQLISVHQNFWMLGMGISSIRIETAGGSVKEGDGAAGSVSSRWFVPVVTDDKVAVIVNELREGLAWGEKKLDWRSLSPLTTQRLTRIAVVISVVIGLIGLAFLRPWGALFGVGASVPLVLYAIQKSRAMRYARTEDGVVYRSGLFTKKLSMTFFDRIQALRVGQSPFDRRWKMAELSVDTAAAGPAEHRIRVPYLTKDFAEGEYLEILWRASES